MNFATRLAAPALTVLAILFGSASVYARDLPTAVTELATTLAADLDAKEMLVIGPIEGNGAASMGIQFSNTLVQVLTEKHGFQIAETSALKAALNEAAIAGASGNDTIIEMGAASGARVVIVGALRKVTDVFFVNLRALRVEDGSLLTSVTTSFSPNDAATPQTAKTLHGELRRLSDHLAAGLDSLGGVARYERFAVLPFEEVGEQTKLKQLGLLVSSELTTLLRRDHGLMLVERSQLSKVIEELALGQTGLVETDKQAEVGRLVGAQGLIIGTVSEVGDHYIVSARVVSASDGRIQYADQVELPAADLIALSSEAVVLRTRAGAIYRSLLLPGWGQLYNRQPVKSALFVGGEVLAAGLATIFHLRGSSQEGSYDDMESGNFNEQRLDAESNYQWRNAMIWTAVGLHAVNLVDAWLNGRSFDSAQPGNNQGAFSDIPFSFEF